MADREFLLYDSLSRQVKPLETLEQGHLRFYTCGPTVYSYAHIGNFRSFLAADLVVRTARALGWRVTWVSNITDVGHLTQDDVADAGGEDRMEKALHSKEGEQFANVWQLAEFYADKYIEDWRRLNLTEPTVRPKATQHVREQILMTVGLIEKGNAYETPTGVYFDVESDPNYGKLSGNTREKLQEAVRDVVLDGNKRRQADFALWKKDDKHLMQWYSPWGWGFPGWHIECSAMARAYLGDTIDLHSGGEDNAFPHHECEIAQSEAYSGKTFSNHWMHVRFLQVEGEKMAKRGGNFYTVRDLVEEGYDPLALRLALISVPYGKPMNFTLQSLRDAQGHIERFRECERRVEASGAPRPSAGEGPGGEGAPGARPGSPPPTPPSVSPGTNHPGKAEGGALGADLARLYNEALDAMANDLNTSVAIAKALEGTRVILREASLTSEQGQAARTFLDQVNALLGIVRTDYPNGCPEAAAQSTPEIDGRPIDDWVAERDVAKKAKDFARADAIRNRLNEEGIELRDSPEGTTWAKRIGA
ncbi:MAG: cysteine--tRNA ligase [Fimbriimonadaceae bacterium]|nr:cysteine--tRNA ligase [Fimbriimonadaceae bacterium]QYK56101.1 MAG: cysteine--tRNA ligase [Fimbriimonadaceae bacterium]